MRWSPQNAALVATLASLLFAPSVLGAEAAPVVVLDAGHGGSNSGAPGARDAVLEKRLTLDLARRVGRVLQSRGVRVVMTRDRDRFLTLRQRSAVANRAGAALFISIHANASRDHSRRGFETYVLSPEALEVDARALRAEPSERRRPGAGPEVARMLDDVERRLAQPRARQLAEAIQRALARARPHSPDRGVKEESMHVLLGATMPAVLVEVGFLDHPVEGAELLEEPVKDQIARELAGAIAEHL